MGDPYPGFSGNAAGATGAALAIASGGLWWTVCCSSSLQQPLCLPPCLQGPEAQHLPWPQVRLWWAACKVRLNGALAWIHWGCAWMGASQPLGCAELCGAPSQHFSLQFGQMLKASVLDCDLTTHDTQRIQDGALRRPACSACRHRCMDLSSACQHICPGPSRRGGFCHPGVCCGDITAGETALCR